MPSKEQIEKIKEILTRIDVSEDEVKKILLMKKSRNNYVGFKEIPTELKAVVFAYADLEKSKMIKLLEDIRGFKYTTAKLRVNEFIRYLRDKLKISFDEIRAIRDEKKKQLNKYKRQETQADKIVEKLKGVLSFFNIKSERLKQELNLIENDGKIDEKEYLKGLYALRQLFLAKARGEIVTQQVEVLYEIEEVDGKIVKKQVYENKNGKKIVSVKTQSHLPDEKAIVAMKMIDEMILSVESATQIELTEEELRDTYLKYLQETEKQRLQLLEEKLSDGD